jgi:hypothetical protein
MKIFQKILLILKNYGDESDEFDFESLNYIEGKKMNLIIYVEILILKVLKI